MFLLSGSTGPALAGDAPSGDAGDRIAEELNRLNGMLEVIRELLAEQLETQDIGLVFKRVEFAAARVDNLEEQLRRARGERRTLERDVETSDLQLEQMSEGRGPFDNSSPKVIDAFFQQLEAGLERTREELRKVSNEVGELESQLSSRRIELREWEELLDKRLTGDGR